MFWYLFVFKTLALGYNGWVLKENMPCCALEVSNYQALIRDMLVFQQSLTKSLSNLCFFIIFTIHQFIKSVYFTTIMFIYLGNFTIFPAKVAPGLLCWGYFVKFHLFPPKSHVMLNVYYICVLSNHCIKYNFMPIVCLLSKLIILWHFHFKMSNSVLHAMPSILVQ